MIPIGIEQLIPMPVRTYARAGAELWFNIENFDISELSCHKTQNQARCSILPNPTRGIEAGVIGTRRPEPLCDKLARWNLRCAVARHWINLKCWRIPEQYNLLAGRNESPNRASQRLLEERLTGVRSRNPIIAAGIGPEPGRITMQIIQGASAGYPCA